MIINRISRSSHNAIRIVYEIVFLLLVTTSLTNCVVAHSRFFTTSLIRPIRMSMNDNISVINHNDLTLLLHRKHSIFCIHRGGDQDLITETIQQTADSVLSNVVIDYDHLIDDA